MSIYLTRLSTEKLRSVVKARARGEGDKINFLSDRAAADKQVEKRDQNPTLRAKVLGLPVINSKTGILNSSKFFVL